MIDEIEFRRLAESALKSLMEHLIVREAEEDSRFEVEEQGGALHTLFEDSPDKFVISPNAAVRQIWIAARLTSFKLDWIAEVNAFVLPKTGEHLIPLIDRLLQEQLAA